MGCAVVVGLAVSVRLPRLSRARFWRRQYCGHTYIHTYTCTRRRGEWRRDTNEGGRGVRGAASLSDIPLTINRLVFLVLFLCFATITKERRTSNDLCIPPSKIRRFPESNKPTPFRISARMHAYTYLLQVIQHA